MVFEAQCTRNRVVEQVAHWIQELCKRRMIHKRELIVTGKVKRKQNTSAEESTSCSEPLPEQKNTDLTKKKEQRIQSI